RQRHRTGTRSSTVPSPASLMIVAILSLLLQYMECGLGQFVGDDVVTDHLAPSSLMAFQLSFVTATHLRIATYRMHGCLRKRCFQIVIALLAGAPAPGDVAGLGDAGDHA